MDTIVTLKRLMNLLLVMAVFMSLTASVAAHAQNLNLGYYDSFLTLTDSNTNKSYTGQLSVTQDNLGNVSGAFYLNNTTYQVTGTLTWWGPDWPQWYWLDITASWHSSIPWIYYSSTIDLTCWVYEQPSAFIDFWYGNYTWYSGPLVINQTPSTGTFSGYGFVPPR